MGEGGRRARLPSIGETEIIETVFAPLTADVPGSFGLKDDAALLTPAAGEELVVTLDAIVAGVHFLDRNDPADIAYKALGVNVSDLVAKGADPSAYLLSIALPGDPESGWLADLRQGLEAAQADFGCRLLGGDTVRTPGPLSLSVTALGRVPAGGMVHRFGARDGDVVYVTGPIGDAALGLRLLQTEESSGDREIDQADRSYLVSRYLRPAPDPALAPIIRACANAAMDVSDGLVGDFAKLCAASGCSGQIEAGRVPLSAPAQSALETGAVELAGLLGGGDDYCVLATVPGDKAEAFECAARDAGATAAQIGRIGPGKGVVVLGRDGSPMQLSRASYDHFGTDSAF